MTWARAGEFALIALAATSFSLNAQTVDDARATISVGVTGHVEVPADHAILTLGVQVQDSTPTLAAEAMDRSIGRVIDTLTALGFPAESLPTARYQVTPTRDRNRMGIVGYDASSAVRLSVWDMTAVPATIEAALAAGATDLTGLQFGASGERAARDEALRRAIAEALHEAEVIAAAAGGEVGPLIDISTQGSGVRAARTVELAGVGARGPQITPGNIAVAARVSVRWAFVENNM